MCKTTDSNSYAAKSRAMCRLDHIAILPVSNNHMLYTSIIMPAQKSATKRKKKEEAVKRTDEIHLFSVNKPINPAALLASL